MDVSYPHDSVKKLIAKNFDCPEVRTLLSKNKATASNTHIIGAVTSAPLLERLDKQAVNLLAAP